MRGVLLCAVASLLAVGTVAGAEPPAESYAPPAPTVAPQARLPQRGAKSAPPAVAQDAPKPTPLPAPVAARPAHLLAAADHLDAAGMHEEATDLRERAEQFRDGQLKEKLAELERLQAEIAALRNAAKPGQQIVLQVKILGLSGTKLRNLGFGLATLDRDMKGLATSLIKPGQDDDEPKQAVRFGIVSDGGAAGLTEALQKEGIANVLGEPTLVTVDRRPACYAVGAEVGVPCESGEICFRSTGTKIDFVPTIVGSGRLRLKIQARVSRVDPVSDVMTKGVRIPGFRSVEFDTDLVMQFGDTAMIVGLVQPGDFHRGYRDGDQMAIDKDEVETIVLITPELITARAPLPASSR